MKRNLVFASRHHQNFPFRLGGLTFLSRRLNGEEELLLAETANSELSSADRLQQQAERMAELLRSRLTSGEAASVDINSEWTLTKLGDGNTLPLLQFFRTGVRPPEFTGEGVTFDLPVWGEPIVLGDEGQEFAFEARSLSYAEQMRLVAAAPQMDEDGQIKDLQTALRMIADVNASLLSARSLDGHILDGAWLLQHLQLTELNDLATYLTSGQVPGEASPNAASAGAPIPA